MRKLRWADLVQGIWKRGGTTASISTVRRLSENVKSHLGHLSQAITIDKSRYRKVSQAEIPNTNLCAIHLQSGLFRTEQSEISSDKRSRQTVRSDRESE